MDCFKGFLKGIAVMLLGIIILLVLTFGSYIFISWIQGIILIPDNFTIWGIREPYSKIAFIFPYIICGGILYLLFKIKERKEQYKISLSYKTKKFLKVSKAVVPIIFLIILYIFYINIICITDQTIILRDTFNPLGIEYSLNDVKVIETGFASKKEFLGVSKGTFYYKITLKDGEKIDINNFSAEGKKYEEDTYSAIEEIDKKIMESNDDVVKTSSLDYYEYAGLADQYMDRFQRIIENKR